MFGILDSGQSVVRRVYKSKMFENSLIKLFKYLLMAEYLQKQN